MRCHHSRIVVRGLGGQLHPSLGEKVPDGLQIAIGRRDAQKPALVNTEQGQDFGEMAAVRNGRENQLYVLHQVPGRAWSWALWDGPYGVMCGCGGLEMSPMQSDRDWKCQITRNVKDSAKMSTILSIIFIWMTC